MGWRGDIYQKCTVLRPTGLFHILLKKVSPSGAAVLCHRLLFLKALWRKVVRCVVLVNWAVLVRKIGRDARKMVLVDILGLGYWVYRGCRRGGLGW